MERPYAGYIPGQTVFIQIGIIHQELKKRPYIRQLDLRGALNLEPLLAIPTVPLNIPQIILAGIVGQTFLYFQIGFVLLIYDLPVHR
jgi:hypothetical protein